MSSLLAHEDESSRGRRLVQRNVTLAPSAKAYHDLSLLDEVNSGRGYQSHYGKRTHFGLHNRATIDRVEVRWPRGVTDVHRNIGVD